MRAVMENFSRDGEQRTGEGVSTGRKARLYSRSAEKVWLTMAFQNRPNSYDVIIVGAGHNGLTAGAYLAKAGLSVLILEARPVVGGACVTEEVAPGKRVSSCSYIASMLRPKVIRDLDLPSHGLKMIPCDPYFSIPAPDGGLLAWWSDPQKTAAGIRKYSNADAATFLRVDKELKATAKYLQPFFLEPPPDLAGAGFSRFSALFKTARRFAGVSGPEFAALTEFLTGSTGEFLERQFETEVVRRLYLANNVYGKHGGPYDAGTAMGFLFHLLGGGDSGIQGYSGHTIGGMGAITDALAGAARNFGAEIHTGAPVARIDVKHGRAAGVTLEDGATIEAAIVVSNADPKRTFLKLLPKEATDKCFRRRIQSIKMNGPAGKLNLALSAEPQLALQSADASPAERAVFTDVPTLNEAQRCYDLSQAGEIAERLWVDVVIPSYVDKTLAPEGTWMMTCFIQYLPYRLASGDWDSRREALGDQVIRQLTPYIPNLPDIIEAKKVLTPLDLQRTYNLTEGNIFHGDLNMTQLFYMRPVHECSQYETPIEGLFLCGAGVHPGGGVTGAPGHNAAAAVLKKGRRILQKRSRRKEVV